MRWFLLKDRKDFITESCGFENGAFGFRNEAFGYRKYTM